MNPLSLSKTHTTKFILPMAFDENTIYNKVLTENFIDTYIAVYDKPEYDNNIIIRINPNYGFIGDEGFKDNYLDDTCMHYIYEIPDHWADDYVKILAGKYSELSEEYKQHLLKFWDEDSQGKLHQVLYKDKNAMKTRELEIEENIDFSKLDELYSPPTITNEIYGLGAL